MNILLTAPIPGVDKLKGDLNTIILDYPGKQEVIERIRGCVGLIPLLSFSVDDEVIAAGDKLKVIANYAVGYDNIDLDYATEKGIAVLNTPDVLTRSTAELTWALIFAVSRRIIEADKMVRTGKFSGWKPDLLLGLELKGATLGVVGSGRIGSAVARIGIGLGLKVIYYDLEKKPSLEKLLSNSDIISLHLPLTPKTRHILNRERLQLLKTNAILINTGRGGLVDEKALTSLLEEGKIRAGLDVYEQEPSVPDKLKKLDNVVLLPHIGSATEKARYAMARLAFAGIKKILKGEKPKNIINPEVMD